jgi:hypothetical protein
MTLVSCRRLPSFSFRRDGSSPPCVSILVRLEANLVLFRRLPLTLEQQLGESQTTLSLENVWKPCFYFYYLDLPATLWASFYGRGRCCEPSESLKVRSISDRIDVGVVGEEYFLCLQKQTHGNGIRMN